MAHIIDKDLLVATVDKLPPYLKEIVKRLSNASLNMGQQHGKNFVEVGMFLPIVNGSVFNLPLFTSYERGKISNIESYKVLLTPGVLETLSEASSIYHIHTHPGKDYYHNQESRLNGIHLLIPSVSDASTFKIFLTIFNYLSNGRIRFKNMVVPVCNTCNFVYHAQDVKDINPFIAIHLLDIAERAENRRLSNVQVVRILLNELIR